MSKQDYSIVQLEHVVYDSYTLNVEYTGIPRQVQVRVYKNYQDMRREATLYAVYTYHGKGSRKLKIKDVDFSNALGITIVGEVSQFNGPLPEFLESPHVVVFLSKENLGLKVVANELTQAALYLDSDISEEHPGIGSEVVPYLVGEMVQQCWDKDIIKHEDN